MTPQPAMTLDEASELLRCRPAACAAEVQAAYRKLVREMRPDLDGQVTGEQMQRIQDARTLLLSAAGTDRRRRRRDRRDRRPIREVLPLRRTTWSIPGEPPRSFDRPL